MSIWHGYPGPGAARLARGSAKLRRLIDGAVDKDKCDLTTVTASNQGPAEELGGRIQSCIGIPTDREPGHQTSGNQFGIHASRV